MQARGKGHRNIFERELWNGAPSNKKKDLSECLTERNYIVHAVHPNATSEQKLEIEERLQATIKAEKRCKCLIIQRIEEEEM